jgi:hypothetical protein
MRAKHTSGMGKEFEEAVVSVYEWAKAWRSRSSGASMHAPIDVTTDVSVIECEATENKSYSLKKEFWDEIVQKQHTGKIPMLAIRFRDPVDGKHIDLAVMDLHDASQLQEEVEVYRDLSLERNG